MHDVLRAVIANVVVLVTMFLALAAPLLFLEGLARIAEALRCRRESRERRELFRRWAMDRGAAVRPHRGGLVALTPRWCAVLRRTTRGAAIADVVATGTTVRREAWWRSLVPEDFDDLLDDAVERVLWLSELTRAAPRPHSPYR